MLDTNRAVPFVTCHDPRIRSGRFAEMNENSEQSPLEETRWRLEFALHLHVCCVVHMQVEFTSCGAAILKLMPRLPERLWIYSLRILILNLQHRKHSSFPILNKFRFTFNKIHLIKSDLHLTFMFNSSDS